ncbi:MAG TPA: stage III sporulation protein AB [Clostridiaceae bacterium]|nr:stage III sporulation protein AB [Clostridiaceae bacterium]
MLLKIIGSILVIGGSCVIGFTLSSAYSKRPVQLKILQSLIQMLGNEIRFMSSIITDAFERIGRSIDNPVASFFTNALEYLNNEESINIAQAWERAIYENMGKTALNKEDAEILISFGKMLGNSDIQGQLKNIEYTLQQLNLQQLKAEEAMKKYETMYKTLGILGGALAVILLI